ncbi:CPBP family intramembrane metalloprotease [Clostridium sp. AF19-22AC]|jgi:membrane protease YdiL (CAAX protease family)|uniref:CPBP family intramembrane glutamic endopeptidase n=1 Tax=Clostridia TaxID=186801 RepID=UPI000E4AF78E|nr:MULTISPECIES: CPBP family intramembrane glutamic endopeptidase [Clostridia]RHR22904.1 CPBP family intramembrane metalloprotease [Clostridium sp. AF19-22AC]
MEKMNKKELLIFFVIAFGIPFLIESMIFLRREPAWEAQQLVIGMLPAMGAIAAQEYKGNGRGKSNKLYIIVFSYFVIGIVCFALNISGALQNTDVLTPILGIASVVSFLYAWMCCPDLDPFRNLNKAILPILLLIIIMILYQIILYGPAFNYRLLFGILIYQGPAFFFQNLAYFGEEYGWRGFLQGRMQIRFGKRLGVIMVGIIWELWHSLFYYSILYSVPKNELFLFIIVRLVHTMGFAVFLGWAYMRTNNIWVCILLHFINNTLMILPTTKYVYSPIPSNIISILMSIVLFLFIFTKEYRTKEAVKNSIKF